MTDTGSRKSRHYESPSSSPEPYGSHEPPNEQVIHRSSRNSGDRRDQPRELSRGEYYSRSSSPYSGSGDVRDVDGGLEKPAEVMALVTGGKDIYNPVRSKSRNRDRDLYGNRSPIQHERHQGTLTYIDKEVSVTESETAVDIQDGTSLSNYRDDDYRNGYWREKTSRNAQYPTVAGGVQSQENKNSRPSSDSSSTHSDIPSISEEKRQLKKMRGKEWLSGIVATATTIHAAEVVYKSVNRRRKRKVALEQGLITPEQAEKARNRETLMDAAFVGFAALGIHSAVTHWKKTKKKKEEVREFLEKRQKNSERRLRREMRTKNEGGSASNGGDEPNLNSGYSSDSAYYDGDRRSARASPQSPRKSSAATTYQ